MRRLFLCGNWKMNKTMSEAQMFFEQFFRLVDDQIFSDAEICIGTSFTALAASKAAAKSKVKIAAQNVCEKNSGAFTGEVSLPMLQELGVDAVILGHSERRQYFGETSAKVAEKAKLCLSQNMLPIVCIGESLEQREAEATFEVIEDQLSPVFEAIADLGSLIFAYEPIWAIGTGKTASCQQAEDVHAFIRGKINDRYGSCSEKIRILYGGSVTPDNVSELCAAKNIDGALVGGASLKAEQFSKLIELAFASWRKKN